MREPVQDNMFGTSLHKPNKLINKNSKPINCMPYFTMKGNEKEVKTLVSAGIYKRRKHEKCQ